MNNFYIGLGVMFLLIGLLYPQTKAVEQPEPKDQKLTHYELVVSKRTVGEIIDNIQKQDWWNKEDDILGFDWAKAEDVGTVIVVILHNKEHQIHKFQMQLAYVNNHESAKVTFNRIGDWKNYDKEVYQ